MWWLNLDYMCIEVHLVPSLLEEDIDGNCTVDINDCHALINIVLNDFEVMRATFAHELGHVCQAMLQNDLDTIINFPDNHYGSRAAENFPEVVRIAYSGFCELKDSPLLYYWVPSVYGYEAVKTREEQHSMIQVARSELERLLPHHLHEGVQEALKLFSEKLKWKLQ